MKQKIFYLLIVICSLSVITSAKQYAVKCGNKTGCIIKKSAVQLPEIKENNKGMAFEFSPFHHLVFNL